MFLYRFCSGGQSFFLIDKMMCRTLHVYILYGKIYNIGGMNKIVMRLDRFPFEV